MGRAGARAREGKRSTKLWPWCLSEGSVGVLEQLHTPALEDTALSRGCWSNAQAVTGWRSEEEDVEETRGIRNRNPHCPHLPSGRAPTSRSCSPGVEECKVAKSLSRWTSQMASSSSAARVV